MVQDNGCSAIQSFGNGSKGKFMFYGIPVIVHPLLHNTNLFQRVLVKQLLHINLKNGS